MGLDNGFRLHSKKYPDLEIEFASFRNYYELDEWCLLNCEHISDYEVEITQKDVEELRNIIRPVAEELMKLGISKLGYYEENGYPKDYEAAFFSSEFNPVGSRSFAAGVKLCRLYRTLECMWEMMEDNGDDICFIFYSSF